MNTDYSSFDWVPFLEDHGIAYVKRGKNVARGHVNIKCPMCGSADPSEHLGVSVTDSKWGCWRDPSHRGRSPIKLIEHLTGLGWKEAKDLAQKYLRDAVYDDREIKTIIESYQQRDKRFYKKRDVSQDAPRPTDTFQLAGLRAKEALRPPVAYLKTRGFTGGLKLFAQRYQILYALKGRHKYRLTFPVQQEGVIRGYVGRSILKDPQVRYLASPDGDALKDAIWNYDRCLFAHTRKFKVRPNALHNPPSPNTLIICEGIFDALKLDFYGSQHGVRAVALLGLSASTKKLSSLARLARDYSKVRICLDRGAEPRAAEIESSLSLCRARCLWLPEGISDAGELPAKEAASFALRASRT